MRRVDIMRALVSTTAMTGGTMVAKQLRLFDLLRRVDCK